MDTKKGQAIYIAPLQPRTLASVKTWGINGELVVQDSPDAKLQLFSESTKLFYSLHHNSVHKGMVCSDVHILILR